MMVIEGTVMRKCLAHDMRMYVDFAASEGWNVGLNDDDFLFRVDPSAYKVAVEGNRVAGTVAAVQYGSDFGFIGYHLVRADTRDMGLSDRLLDEAVDKLGTRTIGLNCLEEKVGYYQSFGFSSAHLILQFEGISGVTSANSKNVISPFMVPFDKLEAFDRMVFPFDRSRFLSSWLSQPRSLSMAKYENLKYEGYGMFRPCVRGYKIAPLLCKDARTAEELLVCLLSHLPAGTRYYMDVPSENAEGLILAEKMLMKKCGELVRMYSPSAPPISLEKIFSFPAVEIG